MQGSRTIQVPKGGRISRNEPCPCGSGQKFKKCCLDTKQGFAVKEQPMIEEVRRNAPPPVILTIKLEKGQLTMHCDQLGNKLLMSGMIREAGYILDKHHEQQADVKQQGKIVVPEPVLNQAD